MRLSKLEFQTLLDDNKLVISLIGMSNIGKTFWSKKFEGEGFKRIGCDDLIEKKLALDLKKLGYAGIADISRWMGQPYDEQFYINQQKYLSLEKEVLSGILTKIKNGNNQNIVIDTTGSIVHTGNNICDKLKKNTLVVYIESTKNIRDQMFDRYIKKPKPVVFGEIFFKKKHETCYQALERCYKELLEYRSDLYCKHADVIIPRKIIKEGMNSRDFIFLIKQYL